MVCKHSIVDRLALVPVVNNLELRPVHEEAARLVTLVGGDESGLEVSSFL